MSNRFCSRIVAPAGGRYATLALLAALLCLPSVLVASTTSHAQDPQQTLETAGVGDFRFGIFGRIYSAELAAPPGITAAQLLQADVPKQLELRYFTRVRKSQIAEAAEAKIREQLGAEALQWLRPVLDVWHAAMRDVDDNDRYLMRYANGELEMLLNGERLISLRSPALAQAYFGIWLGEDPISPSLREALLAGLPQGQQLASDDRRRNQ